MDKARRQDQAAAAVAAAKSATEKRKAATAELLVKLAQPKGVDLLVSAAEKTAEEKQQALAEINAKADQVQQQVEAGDQVLGQWQQTLQKKTQKQLKAVLKALREKLKAAKPSIKLPPMPGRKEDHVRTLLGMNVTSAQAFEELLTGKRVFVSCSQF